MLDPSSSEEESDEIVEEESSKEVLAPAASGARLSPSRTSESSGGGGGLQPSSRSGSSVRPSSPSPSVVSEKEKEELERLQKEEEDRKKKLQLYVFVMRCIAYPFNAKQPTDMARRQQKVEPGWLGRTMEGGGGLHQCVGRGPGSAPPGWKGWGGEAAPGRPLILQLKVPRRDTGSRSLWLAEGSRAPSQASFPQIGGRLAALPVTASPG